MSIVVDDYIDNFIDKDCGLRAFSRKAFDIARAVAYPPANVSGFAVDTTKKWYVYSVGDGVPRLAKTQTNISENSFSRDLLHNGVALDENGQVVLRERAMASYGLITSEDTSFATKDVVAWSVVSRFSSQLEKMYNHIVDESRKALQPFSSAEPITFYVDDFGKVLELTFSIEDMEAMIKHTEKVLYDGFTEKVPYDGLTESQDGKLAEIAALDKPRNIMETMRLRAFRLNWLKLADGFAAAANDRDVYVMKAAAKTFVDGVKKLVEGFEFNEKKLQQELKVEIYLQLSVTRSEYRFMSFSELEDGTIFR